MPAASTTVKADEVLDVFFLHARAAQIDERSTLVIFMSPTSGARIITRALGTLPATDKQPGRLVLELVITNTPPKNLVFLNGQIRLSYLKSPEWHVAIPIPNLPDIRICLILNETGDEAGTASEPPPVPTK